MLEKDKTNELISICRKMTYATTSEFEKYSDFFKIIDAIQNAATPDKREMPHSSYYSDIVEKALAYINDNLSYPIRVGEIAKEVNVSINTLERRFKQFLDVSPVAYIRKKRLVNAAKLLSKGYSVTEAAENSGFCDCSEFISLFRKTYGQTPYAYKKTVEKF